ILVLDPSGIIQDANFGAEKTFGFKREALINKNFSMLFDQSDLPRFILRKTITVGSFRHTNYFLHKDGTRIWARCENIFLKNEEGKENIIKIIHSIQEEKILEERLKSK